MGGWHYLVGNARRWHMLWICDSFKGFIDSPSGMLSSKTGLPFSILNLIS